MSQVSKYLLSEKVDREIKNFLAEIISMLKDKNNVLIFLDDFLSPSEKIVLAKRITIAFMLKKQYDYDIIKKILKVSQSTIAAVNLKLKYSGKGYHQILDQFLKQQKINSAFEKIDNVILDILTIGHGKGTPIYWEEKKRRQKEKSSII